jgi:23S rRNA pseudouridine1911/1915/1917 synthase
MTLEVLYEDNHCLVVNKPAGMLTQADRTGDESIVDLAAHYLRVRYHKLGNVYVGLIHRLDRPTSGVLLLAKTSKAASRLSEEFRGGKVRKVYWAVVEGIPDPPEGTWIDHLEKDRSQNKVRILQNPEGPKARRAQVSYKVLHQGRNSSLVELVPATGRGHQLRVQLADRGHPIVGDRKYGASSRLEALDGRPRIALHAHALTFNHPTRKEAISIVAPVPAEWPACTPR